MGNCLGFGKQGVEANTWASNYQSLHYGGLTPAGGWFAGCQSAGAKGGGGRCSISIHFASFFIGGLLLCLGVIIGFYPDVIGIIRDGDITKFAVDATDYRILPLSNYMIATGVFLLASIIFRPISPLLHGIMIMISLILLVVFLGLTANSVSLINQYKSLPPTNDTSDLSDLFPRIRLLLKKSLVEEMDKYEESKDGLVMMDKIQGELHCCGVHNLTDWQSLNNGTVPASCEGDEGIFQVGCLDQMELRVFKVYYWTAIPLLLTFSIGILVTVFALVFSCY